MAEIPERSSLGAIRILTFVGRTNSTLSLRKLCVCVGRGRERGSGCDKEREIKTEILRRKT